MKTITFFALRVMVLSAVGIAGPAQSAQTATDIPVFKISPEESKIKFHVDSSTKIKGTFDKWDATLTFTSQEVSTGLLEIKIQAGSVDTGSGIKNGKLKGKDFFNASQNPFITFKSTKIEQTGADTFEVDGDFTIRGVTRQEKLTLTLSGRAPALALSTAQWRSTVRNTG